VKKEGQRTKGRGGIAEAKRQRWGKGDLPSKNPLLEGKTKRGGEGRIDWAAVKKKKQTRRDRKLRGSGERPPSGEIP